MINTVIFIFIILEAFLVAIAARRVLGVPIGWPRSARHGPLFQVRKAQRRWLIAPPAGA